LGNEGKVEFRFDEIAYAVSPKRLEQSWKDFKEQMEWSEEFIGITLGEDETSSSAEFVDYGSCSTSITFPLVLPQLEMLPKKKCAFVFIRCIRRILLTI